MQRYCVIFFYICTCFLFPSSYAFIVCVQLSAAPAASRRPQSGGLLCFLPLFSLSLFCHLVPCAADCIRKHTVLWWEHNTLFFVVCLKVLLMAGQCWRQATKVYCCRVTLLPSAGCFVFIFPFSVLFWAHKEPREELWQILQWGATFRSFFFSVLFSLLQCHCTISSSQTNTQCESWHDLL
jgi:hypothetical protein